jgi:protein involved in sex pheromone biosynthesis
MKNIMLITLGAATLFLSSCATVLTGTSDDITFNSTPGGAKIMIDGLEVGKTPAVVSVKRPSNKTTKVTLQMKGYEDRSFALSSSFNMFSCCNGTNLLGWAIDFVTGSLFKYDKTNYKMELEPMAFNLEELKKDQDGNFIVPEILNRTVLVIDQERELEYRFQ